MRGGSFRPSLQKVGPPPVLAAIVTTKFLPHLKQQTRSKNNSRRG